MAIAAMIDRRVRLQVLAVYSGEEESSERSLLESYVFDCHYPTDKQAELVLSARGSDAFSTARLRVS